MQLYDYHGVWYYETYYYDPASKRHVRVRRSTRIKNDGSKHSERTAITIARTHETTIASGEGRRARSTTLAQAIDGLGLALARGQRREATLEIVAEKSRHLYAYFGGARPIESITSVDLVSYADRRLADGAHRGTIDREIQTLRQAWTVARRSGLLDSAPPNKPDLGTVYTPRDRWLPRGEVLRLLSALPVQRRDYVICYLQLGVRVAELYQITAVDCDFARGTVHIRGTKTKNSDRWLPLTPEVNDILTIRAQRRQDGVLFATWPNCSRDLFAACDRAGIDRCSPNDFRRTYATELARAGTPMPTLIKLLGHTDGRMLERVYAQCATEDKQSAVDRLPTYLGGLRQMPAKLNGGDGDNGGSGIGE